MSSSTSTTPKGSKRPDPSLKFPSIFNTQGGTSQSNNDATTNIITATNANNNAIAANNSNGNNIQSTSNNQPLNSVQQPLVNNDTAGPSWAMQYVNANMNKKVMECAFCSENHKSIDCPKPILERVLLFFRRGDLCQKCLNKHKSTCYKKGACDYCGDESHNAALCPIYN